MRETECKNYRVRKRNREHQKERERERAKENERNSMKHSNERMRSMRKKMIFFFDSKNDLQRKRNMECERTSAR